MNQDAIWTNKKDLNQNSNNTIKEQINKLNKERNSYIINMQSFNMKEYNENEVKIMLYEGDTQKMIMYKAEIITEMFNAIEKEKVSIIIIIKHKWKSNNVNISCIKQNFKEKKPNFYINENDEVVLIKNRYLDKYIVLTEKGLEIDPWIRISKISQSVDKKFQINIIKNTKNEIDEQIFKMNLGKWVCYIQNESRIIDINYQSKIRTMKLAIKTDKEQVKQIYENRMVFFKRNIKNKLYIEAIKELIQNINQNRIMNLKDNINLIKQITNISKVKVECASKILKEGFIDSRFLDMAFLQDSKKAYWEMLSKFYKHDKRETFFNTHITETIWNQIATYFKGKLQPYKPYKFTVSEIELTDTKILITKEQVCYPKSNALDKEGFDAAMIIKFIYNNIKRKNDQQQNYINIMIGPLIASIMSQTDTKNIARTFYLLKKNDEVIDKMDKVRILYILPAMLRIFESSTFYVIAKSIAEKVNENEIINFASLKGLSAKNMISKIKEEWKEGTKKAIIQLDLSRAFDSVEHDNLKKAIDYYYGVTKENEIYIGFQEITIKKLMLKWLDIITNMATYNDDENKLLYKKIGLPMGSSLSPAMFVLYLNFVLKDYPFKRCHYSDDTYVIVDAKEDQIEKAIIYMQNSLNKANMKLNLNKSKLIIKQSNLDESIQKVSKKYNIIVQTQLDILGLTLSMNNLTQIKYKLPDINNLKDLIESNLSFSTIVFVLNNANFGAALYRANSNNDVDEEIIMLISYIYEKLKNRWKFLTINHIIFIMPKLIEALAIKPLRAGEEEQRNAIFKRLSVYKDFFKGEDKARFLNLLKKTKIDETLEKSNQQVVEEYIKNRRLMGIMIDEEEKKDMMNTLNKERRWGLKAWKHTLKEIIKNEFGLEEDGKVLWANDLIKKDKPVVYIWILKLMDKKTRENRDNFIFRKMIKAIDIINKDEEMEHIEKINQIYEQITEIKSTKIDKTIKSDITDYKNIIRTVFDKQLAWKIFWLNQIKKDFQTQDSTSELNQTEEAKLTSLAENISKNINIPSYEKEKKARRKMYKAIAQTGDILISNLNHRRYNIKELNEEFYKTLDALTGQEITKDYKEVTIIRNQYIELIETNLT